LNIRQINLETLQITTPNLLPEYYYTNIYMWFAQVELVPKISLDMPAELVEDLRKHVGDDHKFVSLADAVRTACRKLLDQLDEIDARHGR
jgi:hypothetical protein